MGNYIPFRIIGRLSFPIFAYLIAEGCYYTRNRVRYFLTIFITGAICQLVFTFFSDSLHMNIFITFSMSILIIFSIYWARENYDTLNFAVPFVLICFAVFVTTIFPDIYKGFKIDYGFFGILIPVVVSLSRKKHIKLLLFVSGMIFLCIDLEPIQWWSMLAVIPVALYNGSRGTLKMKYFFYIYYPLHLALIYTINTLIN